MTQTLCSVSAWAAWLAGDHWLLVRSPGCGPWSSVPFTEASAKIFGLPHSMVTLGPDSEHSKTARQKRMTFFIINLRNPIVSLTLSSWCIQEDFKGEET
jgi:hypothetical protein